MATDPRQPGNPEAASRPEPAGNGADETLTSVLGDRITHLVPTHLRTMNDLLAREHASILAARRWSLRRTRSDVLSVSFLMSLHRKMFDGIWRWAGHLRRTDHPDGARWPTIGIELNDLIGEARFWRERKLYSADELALRFHHRLIRIRAWEGGNGTHARLATDALAASLNSTPFIWGRHIQSYTALHAEYAAALRDADSGVMRPLLRFARGG